MYDALKATLDATWRAPCVAMTTIHKLDLKKVFMTVVLMDETNQIKLDKNVKSTKTCPSR